MKNYIKYFIFISLIVQTSHLFSQHSFTKQSARIANYDIKVELNTETKTLIGSQLLKWTNSSPDTISELQFHLYMNAFKNQNSTFMIESFFTSSAFDSQTYEDQWGWIEIINLQIDSSVDLSATCKYLYTEAGNKDDQTVMACPVRKILPNQTVDIKIDYIVKLPQAIARTGYYYDYFFIAQWFPKIGVLEYKGIRNAEKTKWNCHQYHYNSEFYANFGVYNVEITVPNEYYVGASGFLYKKKYNANNTKTLSYKAEDVIDFTWVASKKFIEFERVWKGTIVKVLILPEHINLANRHINAAIKAIDYFESVVGEYPYPNITIVDVPLDASQFGSMEYPTLISTLSVSFIPFWIKTPEQITIHEFGHNYFMATLANNEAEEPWLDEGFASYHEANIMQQNYPSVSFLGYNFETFDILRANYTLSDDKQIAPINNKSWEFPLFSYNVLTYSKAAIVLKTLENLVGEETMIEINRTYYERWKFNHPTAKNFIDIVNEIVKQKNDSTLGENMNWFFDQTIYHTYICDYELNTISNKAISRGVTQALSEFGFNWGILPEEINYAYESSVTLSQKGEMTMPVEILIHFESGEEIVEYWNGKDATKTFYYSGLTKILWAKIDYTDKILLDINKNNNSYTTEPSVVPVVKYSSKFLFALQNIIHFFGMLI